MLNITLINMRKYTFGILILFSFVVQATNENIFFGSDSFDIEVAPNFRNAFAVKKNPKAMLYLFSKSMVIDYVIEKKSDTIYFEEVRKIRKGFMGNRF